MEFVWKEAKLRIYFDVDGGDWVGDFVHCSPFS